MIYVDAENGDDRNEGTEKDKPVKTLHAAQLRGIKHKIVDVMILVQNDELRAEAKKRNEEAQFGKKVAASKKPGGNGVFN
jgi:hypothetical protein